MYYSERQTPVGGRPFDVHADDSLLCCMVGMGQEEQTGGAASRASPHCVIILGVVWCRRRFSHIQQQFSPAYGWLCHSSLDIWVFEKEPHLSHRLWFLTLWFSLSALINICIYHCPICHASSVFSCLNISSSSLSGQTQHDTAAYKRAWCVNNKAKRTLRCRWRRVCRAYQQRSAARAARWRRASG